MRSRFGSSGERMGDDMRGPKFKSQWGRKKCIPSLITLVLRIENNSKKKIQNTSKEHHVTDCNNKKTQQQFQKSNWKCLK